MNQIKAGAVLNYVIIFLNTLVGLAYTPYMLRCLGQNEYGLYSLVASIIAYLTILDFGFGNAIIRYTAKFKAENKEQEQWEMFGMFLIVYSIIGIIAFFCGLGLYFNIDLMFSHTMSAMELEQAQTMMLLLTVNLGLTFPLSIFGAIITAYENFVFQRIINIIRIIASTAVMIIVLSVGYRAVALVVITTIFNILTLVINYLYCKYKLRIHIFFSRFDIIFFKEVTLYSFWIFLNAIVEKLYWGSGQFVLGSLIGTTAVAIFSIAILLEQMFVQFSAAISSVLLPKITTMVTKKNSDHDLSEIFIRTGRIQTLVLTLITSGFLLFGKSFIMFWAGKGYNQSYIITVIFFICLFIPLIQNTGVTILQARNDLKFRSLCYVGISILSFVAQIYLTKLIGVIGCAIAIGIGMFIGQVIIMNWYYQTKQNIDIKQFWKEISRMSTAPICVTIIFFFLLKIITINSLCGLTLSIAIFTIIYLLTIYRFSLNSYEKNLCNGILKKRVLKKI